MSKIFLYADASSKIGFGHVSRIASIAQALASLGSDFLVLTSSQKGADYFESLGIAFRKIAAECNRKSLAEQITPNSVLLIDSYSFGLREFDMLKECVRWLGWMDDFGVKPEGLDFCINANIHASEDSSETLGLSYLAGPKYVLLNSEYWLKPVRKRKIEGRPSLLITAGGSDVMNLTPRIIRLGKASPVFGKILVVLGGGFQNRNEIEKEMEGDSRFSLRENVNCLRATMEESDFAIAAAGSTMNELFYMRISSFGIAVAENQLPLIKAYQKLGFLVSSSALRDDFRSLDQEIIAFLKKIESKEPLGPQFFDQIDGKGAIRIAKFLAERLSSTQ